MKTINLIIFLTIMTGCESVVDFPNLPQAPEYPVIEGLLTDQDEVQKIRVSYTTALDDSVSSRPVNNATVYVFSDAGDTAVYHYTVNGWYASSPYHADPGKTYTLYVNTGNASYTAKGALISMNGIDSIYARRLPNVDKDSAYFTFINAGAVDPTVTRYYQINLYKNDSLLTGGTNIAVFNDKYLSALRAINLPYAFSKNDTVTLELYSLSKAMFSYYESLTINVFSLNFVNSGYRTNPPQMFSKFAAGYFQVSAVDKKQIVIR